MPDRYGNPNEPDTHTTQLHAIAITVPCQYCGAAEGQPCTNQTLPKHPPTRIPHTTRINAAQEVPF